MAVKILAYPTDDKRKAAVQTFDFSDLPSGGTLTPTTNVIDIRGFANFTILVQGGATTESTIMVSDSPTSDFVQLSSLGGAAAVIANIPTTTNSAYDVPELAGCHYITLVGHVTGDAGTVKIMGKV